MGTTDGIAWAMREPVYHRLGFGGARLQVRLESMDCFRDHLMARFWKAKMDNASHASLTLNKSPWEHLPTGPTLRPAKLVGNSGLPGPCPLRAG